MRWGIWIVVERATVRVGANCAPNDDWSCVCVSCAARTIGNERRRQTVGEISAATTTNDNMHYTQISICTISISLLFYLCPLYMDDLCSFMDPTHPHSPRRPPSRAAGGAGRTERLPFGPVSGSTVLSARALPLGLLFVTAHALPSDDAIKSSLQGGRPALLIPLHSSFATHIGARRSTPLGHSVMHPNNQ